jgi:hypothetical protein
MGFNLKQIKIFHNFFSIPSNPHEIEITEQTLSGTCVFGRSILNVLGCVWLDL